jgi:2-dehydropantoate 2-reductase
MKIVVMGAGGVGGYFGAGLAKAGEEVYFIARGDHLRAIREGGLTVESVTGDFKIPIIDLQFKQLPAESPAAGGIRAYASENPKEIGTVDLVLFCVKTYDTEAASKAVFPLVGPRTTILSLQNGVDSADKLGRDHGRDHILGGTAYIYSALRQPGIIAQTGGPRKIVFGELNGKASSRTARIKETFDRAMFPNEVSPDIKRAIWEKFAMICANGGMSALTRVTLGEMLKSKPTWSMLEKTLKEVVTIGIAEGISFDARFVEKTMRFLETLEPEGRASLYHDLANHRRMELDSLNGRVVQFAKKHGIPVPMNFAIYAALSPHLI